MNVTASEVIDSAKNLIAALTEATQRERAVAYGSLCALLVYASRLQKISPDKMAEYKTDLYEFCFAAAPTKEAWALTQALALL